MDNDLKKGHSDIWREKFNQGLAKLVSISAPKNYNTRGEKSGHHIKSNA